MRRVLSIIIILALFLTASAAASADTANEHIDDYYWRNTRLFDHSVEGDYYIDSADGYVSAWMSPAALKLVDNLPNGAIVHVQAQYNGWATAAYLADGHHVYANEWFPADLLTPVYSTASFAAEYADAIDRESEYSDFITEYKGSGELCFYSYPGSGELSSVVELAPSEPLTLEAVFTDVDGTRWGWCEYYSYMDVNGWVCLEAPENAALPATRRIEPKLKSEPLSAEELASAPRLRYDYIIGGGVYAAAAVAAAAVAAVAALLLRKKKPLLPDDGTV